MNDRATESPLEEDLSQVPMPGRLIRTARQQRQLSEAQLAENTRLGLAVVEALEKDDYAALGQPVYARGYYRKCAQVLGLNGEALVDAYEKRSGTGSPIPQINQRPSIRYREGPGWLKIAFLVLVGLSLLGAGAWSLTQHPPSWLQTLLPLDDGAPSASSQDPEPSPSPTDSVPGNTLAPQRRPAPAVQPAAGEPDAEQKTPGQAVRAVDTATAVATPAPASRSGSASAGAQRQVAQVEIPRPEGRLRIVLQAGASWTEITDSRGEQLVYKLLQAGDSREVVGSPPYTIVLGRADQVLIWIDGRSVDLDPYIQTDLRARVQIARDGQVSQG